MVQAKPDSSLKTSWIAWLATFPWDWFITATFRTPVPRHRQETVLNAVAQSLIIRYEPSHLFLAAEPHLSYAVHLHGLFESSSPSKLKGYERYSLWARLFRLYGRAKVEPPRGSDAVVTYITKYCVKDGGYYQVW